MVEGDYLSAVRTVGYTALSIEVLGRAQWQAAAFVGYGTQASAHIDLLARRFPQLATVHLFDVDPSRAEALAAATAARHLS